MLNLHISNSKTINITPLASNITILSQVHYRLNSLYHITSPKQSNTTTLSNTSSLFIYCLQLCRVTHSESCNINISPRRNTWLFVCSTACKHKQLITWIETDCKYSTWGFIGVKIGLVSLPPAFTLACPHCQQNLNKYAMIHHKL